MENLHHTEINKSTTHTSHSHKKEEEPVQPHCRDSHILHVSSSLLGICLVMVTSLRMFARSEQTLVSEFTAMATLLFMVSCVLSFLSIRRGEKSNRRLENVADFVFLSGLAFLFITTLLFSFNIIR